MIAKKYLLIAVIVSNIITITATNRLYLENNYGEEIACKVNDRADVRVPYTTPYLSRVFLGTIALNKTTPLALVKSIEIRATGLWSGYGMTPYTSLFEKLLEARWMQKLHCNTNNDECSKDAILVVNRSGIASEWDVSLRWERPTTTFEMDNFDDKSILMNLKTLVENGSYEQVVALVNKNRSFLKTVLSDGQINAIVTGAHHGADPHQKSAAMRFITQALNK